MANDGKMALPRVDSAMNKIAPSDLKNDDETGTLGKDKSKKKRENDKVLATARKRMDRCISAEGDNRKNGLDDRKFEAGDQWPTTIMALREQDRRPCHTANKIPTLMHQVVNDIRQNRPSLYASPIGDKSDRDTALLLTGLFRDIHRQSHADIAYDTGVHDAASNGFGYWRIVTEYEAPESFDQVIRIRRVRNPFSVYLDPDHQEPDAADIRYAFVSEMVPREEFEAEWPDADPMPWDKGGIGEKYKEWVDKDTIRVAEYFEITHETRNLVSLSNGFIGWEDELHELIEEQIESGEVDVIGKRTSQVPKVIRRKITAVDVLEEDEWPGRWIPIVKIIADEVDIEGKVKLSGIIRHAKSSQQMLNYYKSAEIEAVALAPKTPWIVEEGQIEGYEDKWQQANTKSYPYLPYRGTSIGGHPAPPPQRVQFASVPAGIVQGYQSASEDIQATTGIRFDGSLREKLNDESGKALRELGRRGELGSFHIADNFSRAMVRTGDIILDLIPKIYDARRIITILREDDKEERVAVDPNGQKGQQAPHPTDAGKVIKVLNPTLGKYSVAITAGPSHSTRRQEAEESIFKLIAAVPQVAPAVLDLIARMADWPMAKEFEARLAKLVPPGIMTPDPKDMSPQVAGALRQMQQQIKKMQIEKVQLTKLLNDKNADRALIQDKTDKDFEAKLLAVVQKQEAVQMREVGSKLSDLSEQVKNMVTQLQSPVAIATNTDVPVEDDFDTMSGLGDITTI